MKNKDIPRFGYAFALLVAALKAVLFATTVAAIGVWLVFGVACLIEAKLQKTEKTEIKKSKKNHHLYP